jgi:transposase
LRLEAGRVERLSSIDGVGAITALTWALEVGDPHRFASIGDAVSYCGLTAAFRSSAGKQQRRDQLRGHLKAPKVNPGGG